MVASGIQIVHFKGLCHNIQGVPENIRHNDFFLHICSVPRSFILSKCLLKVPKLFSNLILFGTSCMGLIFWNSLLGTPGLGLLVWDSLLGTPCLGLLVWESLFGTPCLGLLVWESLFRTPCLGHLESL